MELQKHLKTIEAAGCQVMGISYDSGKVLKKAAAKLKVTFPMLSDPDSKTIDAFGIRQLDYAGKRWDGVPHPMTLIIDSRGIVRDKLAHEGYRKRHSSADLIEALKKLRSPDPERERKVEKLLPRRRHHG